MEKTWWTRLSWVSEIPDLIQTQEKINWSIDINLNHFSPHDQQSVVEWKRNSIFILCIDGSWFSVNWWTTLEKSIFLTTISSLQQRVVWKACSIFFSTVTWPTNRPCLELQGRLGRLVYNIPLYPFFSNTGRMQQSSINCIFVFKSVKNEMSLLSVYHLRCRLETFT